MGKYFRTISIILAVLQVCSCQRGWRAFESVPDTYGKPCLNGTIPQNSNLVNCDREIRSMICTSNGICECVPSPAYRKIEYDTETKSCLAVPVPEDDFRCQTDNQCQVSSYGKYSQCNQDMGQCQCYHETAVTELVNNVCYIVRPVAFSESYPSCESNEECQRSSLGNVTRCNMSSKKCECFDAITGGKNEVGYYEGICVYKKKLGEFCERDEECRVGYHRNAVCVAKESFLVGEKACVCPGNDPSKCDGNGAGIQVGASTSTFVLGLTTILMGVLANTVMN